jgi:hypothetical protein
MRRGIVFSLDAIIVLGLVLVLAFFLAAMSFSYSSPELRYQRMYYTGKDLLNVIEQAKLSSVQDNPVVQGYFSSRVLVEDDLDKSILDVIGSLWASGNLTEAENLTNSTFAQILNGSGLNYQLLIDGQLIHEKNTTPTTFLARLSAIVSGYDIGKPVSGYSARTRLSSVNRISSYYVYFGGYVGDGNITVNFTLPDFDNVLNASMEMNAGNDFTLSINGNPAGTYVKNAAGNMSADGWTISSGYFQHFAPGGNVIGINFTSNSSMYIGGGYLKITYNTTTLSDSAGAYGQNATKAEPIPGIEGLINVYSSFYAPGTLKNMSVYLHYNSSYMIFVNVGNVTVYRGNSSGPAEESLNSTYLSGLLNYSGLGSRTVPFRIGLENVSYAGTGQGIGDSVLVTDVSGSMGDEISGLMTKTFCHYDCRKRFIFCYNSYQECVINPVCGETCSGTVCGTCGCSTYSNYYTYDATVNRTKLDEAKDADRLFVDIVMNQSDSRTFGNRVGLVSYSTSVGSYQNFTNDSAVLNGSIECYNEGGNTCICCGIIRAMDMTGDLSSPERRKSIVVMTDGEANVRCNNADTNLDGINGIDARDDAIQAACDAYNLYNITVYTVGFGASESEVDSNTLNLTAQCGHGKYYYSNVSELANTFKQIATEVLSASYQAQTIEVTGQAGITTLYPDSYIRLDYDSSISPPGYGEVMLTFESPTFGGISGPLNITDNYSETKEAWYYVPENMQPMDVRITSYSSRYWTDRLYVNSTSAPGWPRIYWLGDYNANYTSLGDPFIVQVPVSYVGSGNNSVKLGTGLNSSVGTGASLDDRIIYTLKIGGIAFEQYSEVFPRAKGSTVTVYYDSDGDNLYDGYSAVSYGPDPSDMFDPGNDSIDDSFMRLMDSLNFIWDANPGSYGNGTPGNPYDGVNQTNPVDLQITSDVEFEAVTATGIQSLWGPIRIWS